MRRVLALGVAVLGLTAPTAAGVEQPRTQYATALEGTNAFVGIAKRANCFKAYLSDGTTEGATLSVWFQGCVAPDGRTISAERGGIRIDAQLDRRRAVGTVTLRDGSAHPFDAASGDRGGIVGRRFTYRGRRYRSGWVVLRDNQVRWRIMPIGRGLYGDAPVPPPPACDEARAERGLLHAQLGLLLAQSGAWEGRLNRGRGPTGSQYNRLSQAIGALDERIFALDRRTSEADCR